MVQSRKIVTDRQPQWPHQKLQSFLDFFATISEKTLLECLEKTHAKEKWCCGLILLLPCPLALQHHCEGFDFIQTGWLTLQHILPFGFERYGWQFLLRLIRDERTTVWHETKKNAFYFPACGRVHESPWSLLLPFGIIFEENSVIIPMKYEFGWDVQGKLFACHFSRENERPSRRKQWLMELLRDLCWFFEACRLKHTLPTLNFLQSSPSKSGLLLLLEE